MNRLSRAAVRAAWLLIGVLGVYILGYGWKGQSLKKAAAACIDALTGAEEGIRQTAEKTLYPALIYAAGEQAGSTSLPEAVIRSAMAIFPLYSFLDGREVYETEIESAAAREMLIAGGAHDENEIDVQTGEAFELAEQTEENTEQAQEQAQDTAEDGAGEETEEEAAGTVYTAEQLADFDFLKNTFYIVESNTDVSSEVLDAAALLAKDMGMQQDASAPQILIYHTHSQEGFVDSVAGDNSTTIVGVGEYLAQILRETYGYNVIHNTNVYDLIDGELDRNQAYTLAAADVEQILAENPTIEVIIDLHRDGVKEGTRLVTEVNGKTTAQFMFFNGLSYSKRNGPIDYLENPYIQDNLALSLQMKLACESAYPGLSRKIYLKSLRYNLHLRPKSLLIEAGAQTNTLEEMKNAMEPLAEMLYEVLGNP